MRSSFCTPSHASAACPRPNAGASPSRCSTRRKRVTRVAAEIVHVVGGRIGAYARVSAERTGQLGQPFPLVLCGGVLRHPSLLLRAAIYGAVPEGTPIYPRRRARRRCPPPRRRSRRRPAGSGRHPRRARLDGGARLMGGIRLEQTTKVYPNGVKAIDAVSLDIRDGEFMVLVGPSGCGKSTLLRMIAGLEEVTEGRILIGERDVTQLRPRDRDIAMVFQNYALYPHMSVDENLGFGLKLRRVAKPERESRVRQVSGTLGLKALLDRQAGVSLRRPAATGGDGTRDGARAKGVPDGRAALESRRQAARRHAGRADAAARPARCDHGLRHPRPGRGDDPRAARCRPPRRAPAAVRHTPESLPPSGEPLRRGIHGLAFDERRRGEGGGPSRHVRRSRRAPAAGLAARRLDVRRDPRRPPDRPAPSGRSAGGSAAHQQ